MADYAQLLQAGREAVALACGVCREIQRGDGAVRALTKDDRSPVTIADFAGQAIIARTLRERLWPIPLIAEESSGFLRRPEHAAHLAATVAAARGVWPDVTQETLLDAIDSPTHSPQEAAPNGDPPDAFWTLDPIDGTKGFLRGQQYAVCLAYIEFGTPVVAVMGCPNLSRDFAVPMDQPDATGSMYFSIRGQGLYETGCRADPDIDGPPVRITRLDHDPTDTITICEAVEVSRRDRDAAAAVVAHLASPHRTISLDSQCKYAVVARGQADAFIRMPARSGKADWIWDHAPGALLATESGCAVTDADSRQFDFSTGSAMTRNRGTVVAPPRLHGRIIGAIRELRLAV